MQAIRKILTDNPSLSAAQVADLTGLPDTDHSRKIIAKARQLYDIPYRSSSIELPIKPALEKSYEAGSLLRSMPNDFPNTPEGDYEMYNPYPMIPGRTALVLNDIHIGHHILKHVIAACAYGRDKGVDTVILNGDIMDCDAVKRHPGKKSFFEQEVIATRAFLKDLRAFFPDCDIWYAFGNHEARFRAFIQRNAWQLDGLFALEDMIGLKELGIKHVPVMGHIVLGDLNIIHGHQIRGGGENVALTLLKKASCNIMFGDRHRSQTFTKTTFEGKMHGGWAVGCLCYLSPEYSLYNPFWANGFAIVKSDESGTFTVENKMFVDGVIR